MICSHEEINWWIFSISIRFFVLYFLDNINDAKIINRSFFFLSSFVLRE